VKCNDCWAENPKGSKFCRKCGTPLGAPLRCPGCGSENPETPHFARDVGKAIGAKGPSKGTRRKCRNCCRFNELDAQFCVGCGEEIAKATKGGLNNRRLILRIGPSDRHRPDLSLQSSCQTGTTFFKGEEPSRAHYLLPSQQFPMWMGRGFSPWPRISMCLWRVWGTSSGNL